MDSAALEYGRLITGYCVLVSSLLCTGCQPSGVSNNGDTQLGRAELFRLHCSGCHGDGSGNGHIAGALPVRPRNLRHHEWQESVSDAHIIKVIREGGAAVRLNEKMPAFEGVLSQDQIESLAAYVRALGR